MKEIDSNGHTIYRNADDYWHRVGLYAIKWDDGEYNWYFNGEIHRLNGHSNLYEDIKLNGYNYDENRDLCYSIYGVDIEINMSELVI